MTPAQRLQAAQAFWRDDQAEDDQMEAVLLIAQRKKFRTKTVLALDEDRKAHHLASLVSLRDTVAARAIVTYHLAEQRPMMAAFLDALGVAHDNGVIQEEAVTPDPSRFNSAAEMLAQQYPPDSVSLYLNTLFCQDPNTWGGLADLPQRRDPG